MGSKREERANVCDRWNLEYVVCFVTRLWRVPTNIWVFTTILVIISHGNKYDSFFKSGNFSGTQLTKVKAKTALNEKQKMNYNGNGVETRYFG
jgi:hypothetical protein